MTGGFPYEPLDGRACRSNQSADLSNAQAQGFDHLDDRSLKLGSKTLLDLELLTLVAVSF